MIIEPNDVLIALIDGSGVRAEVISSLKSAMTVEGEDHTFIVWAPDWFFDAYCHIFSAAIIAGAKPRPDFPMMLGMKVRPNSANVEWSNHQAPGDDWHRHFHVEKELELEPKEETSEQT